MAEAEEEYTSKLSDRANQHLSDNPEGAEAAQPDPFYTRKFSQAEVDAYYAVRERTGPKKSEVQMDRTIPVGIGEGFRNTTNWQDESARRMFALDQGMADQDEARSPTMGSTDALYRSSEYLNHAIQQTQELDPQYAYELQMAERFLVMYPELAIATRNGFGFAGITEQMGATMMGMDVPDFALAASTSFVAQSDIGDQFYTTFGTSLDPATKDILTVSLAGISEKEQKRMYGLSAAYLDARPLDTLEDQVEFANWVSMTAGEIYATESDQSLWGKIGRVGAHVFTNPADYIQDEVIGSLWTDASDPSDAWYRDELQLEETMAISMGYDVGTTGWNTFTGLAGVAIDVIIDPTNIALGGLAGLKAVKTAAYVGDALQGTNRFRAVARQFVPIASRRAARLTGLPVGVRGRSSRILWTTFAKSHDGMMTVARKKGVFDKIYKAKTYTAAIEAVPELSKADPGLVNRLIARESAEAVESLYDAALRGSLLDPASMAHTDILAEEIDASADVKRILSDLEPKTFTAGDIAASNGGKMYHNLPILLDEVDEVKIVARGGDNVAASMDDLVDADLAEVRKLTDDADVSARIDKYEAGDLPIQHDKIDEAIVRDANKHRGMETIASDPAAFAETEKAAARAIESGVELRKVPFDIGDGVMGTAEIGQSDAVGRVTIIRNAAGEMIGGRIDELGGVAVKNQKKGVYERILRLQADELGLTGEEYAASTGPLTADAARVGERVFGRAGVVIESDVGKAADPLAEGLVSYIRKGDTVVQALNPGSKGHDAAIAWVLKSKTWKNKGILADGTISKRALQAYMRANNIDVVTINGTGVFADVKKLRASGAIQTFAGGEAQHTGLADAVTKLKVAAYERRMITPKGDAVSKWVISDMPTGVRTPIKDLFWWNKQFGVFAGTKYSEASLRKRKLRGMVASVFVDDIPPSIATGWANRHDGVQDLRRVLVQMNVDPDLVRRSLDRYVDDPSQAVVLDILRQAGDDLGDEEIILGLMRFNQKNASELEYATINGSDQLTSGLRVDGSTGLQPLLPSQTRNFVQLPEQRAFSAHIRRTKRATNRIFKSRNRGWGETRKNRKKIIDDFGATLGTKSEAAERWGQMTLDEKFATAYAVVRPKGSDLGDGLGYAAKFGQTFSQEWGRLRNAFSVSMLAWRPIGWAGNEMLDNAFRASLADGLNLFTHPFRSLSAVWDTRNIKRAVEQRKLYQAATAPVRAILKAGEEPAVMLDRVAAIIPSIRKYVDVAEDPISQSAAIRKFLNTELISSSDSIKVLDDPLAQALYRQRKGYVAAQKYKLPKGAGDDLFDPNWDEVSLTGMEQNFTSEVAAASSRHEWIIGQRRAPELLEDYTAAIGNVWARDMKDPVVRMYLQQVAEIGAGGADNSRAARAFVNSSAWHTMEDPVRNMARFDGLDVDKMSDLEIAQYYFKNKVGPYVDDIFGDVLDNTDNVGLMLNGSFVADIDGVQHIVDVDDVSTVRDFIQAANGTNYKLPQSVVGVVNPRSVFGYGKEADGWRTPLKSYNQWALNKFGHEIPAAMQRRPAYINTFKRFKENYMRLGMTEEGADFAAKQKAMEHINKTFFFVEAQTPFLKSMNEIFPFFAAQYEIIKAWTWNIPALNGGFGVGHARVLRSFDHVFTAFRENGLLQPHYDKDGRVDSWSLQFASNPATDNLAGEAISRAGHLAMMAPSIMVEQLAEIFTDTDLDLTTDEVNFKFNHPAEFFGKGGGVLPTARMQFGQNPAAALPMDKLLSILPFTSTSNAVPTTEETNLEMYITDQGITDKTQFLTANREKLIGSGAVTDAEFERLKSGTLGFSTVEMPAGLDLMIPGRTLAGDFIDTVLQPYGSTDSVNEVISDFTPRVVANMAKSMGLFFNDGEDGATMWLPETLMGPTGRSGMGAARAEAVVTLEMQHGLLTRSGEVVEEMTTYEEGTPEWLALRDELDQIDDLISKETKEISASRAFVQTIFGVLMPFNPKMPTESQTLREYYYHGRTVAEQWSEGTPMPTPFDGRNAKEAWSMVAAWAADETGSQAKQEFLTQHGGRSSILAAIAPRNYWGGNGLPVWADDMTEYFRQVEAGDIKPMPPDVLRYKIRSMQIQVEREMIFIEEYGNDPMEQALAMLNDGAYYNEIRALYDNKFAALEVEDEIVNDGAWAQHSLEVGDNYVDFAHNDQMEIIEAMDIAMEELDINMFPTDPQEARRIRGKIIGLRDSAYAAVEVYNDGRYADWEVSPRQQIMNEYWQKWGDYNDELQKQYEKVDEADTEQELSAVYDSIARWRRQWGDAPITVQGVKFPSPNDRSWNNMDDEHKSAVADGKLADKLEWLAWSDVDHIIEMYPKSAPYMPTSEMAKGLFDWKADQDALLAIKYRIGGDFIELKDGSRSPRNDHQKVINEEFEFRLREAGEFGVLENINGYPAETFDQFGALPVELQWIVPYAVAVHRQLDAWEKSPLTNAAKAQQRWVFAAAQDQFAKNATSREALVNWGMRVFEESTVEGIIAQLLGNYKGELD